MASLSLEICHPILVVGLWLGLECVATLSSVWLVLQRIGYPAVPASSDSRDSAVKGIDDNGTEDRA